MDLAGRHTATPGPEKHLAILEPGQYDLPDPDAVEDDLTSQLDPDSMEEESNVTGGFC